MSCLFERAEQYRVIIDLLIEDQKIKFINLGDHHEVYP